MPNQDFVCSSSEIGSDSSKECLPKPFEGVPSLEVSIPEPELFVPAVWKFGQTSTDGWD